MGLCRFFQQGSCRYGTKCHNEHFDVKVFLKADMESAINGKMWPFSAYGPFKDKANFPNFIEDQSFEEVRFMCYEAKRLNNFEQFHQQFNREVLEATNKMKTMLQMAPQILDTMIKIYESSEGASVTSAPQQTNNPFAAAAPATNSTSIFGKPTLAAGNIFGAATGQANNSSSIFGGSMATGNTGTNIFGGPATAAPAPNVFGQPQQQQQPPQPVAQAFQGGNLFGQAPVQAQAQPVNPNPFGAFPPAGGMFGQAANPNQGGLFGQAAAQQQQQQQQPPSGLFSQAAGFPNQQQQIQQQQQLQMQQQQQQQQQMMQQQQMLQQQEQQQLQQQQQQQQQVANPAPSLAYSSMDELTADEIEAFKSDQFLPGHLPFKPPPRELC